MTEAEFTFEVGEKIRQKRIQRKMSREALARIVGVHRNSIWRWEEGDAPITMWMFLQICYALSMPHTQMLPGRSVQSSAMLQQLKGEQGIGRRTVQFERDPPMSHTELLKEYGQHKKG
jgi:transcriptional regulator with XRE-family HTH domain